jgi:hypothetical protein
MIIFRIDGIVRLISVLDRGVFHEESIPRDVQEDSNPPSLSGYTDTRDKVCQFTPRPR